MSQSTAAPHTPDALPEAAGRRGRSLVTVETLVYGLIVVLAAISRLWMLDGRAMHHDESLHAEFSHLLFRGQGYVHDPLLHGPALYYAVAGLFFLFGDSDATARLAAALCGIAVVLAPWLVRRQLGRSTALAAALLLLISPVTLYVGRFIRHDPIAVLCEVLVLFGVIRWLSDRSARWLHLAAAALGVMFITMETFYLYVAIFAPLVLGIALWRLWRPGIIILGGLAAGLVLAIFILPGHPQRPFPGSDQVVREGGGSYICPWSGDPWPAEAPMVVDPARRGPIFDAPPLATADNAYALCARHQPDGDLYVYLIKLSQFARHPTILLAILLALGVPAGLLWWLGRRRDAGGQTRWEQALARGDGVAVQFARLGERRQGLIAVGIFAGIGAIGFSAFFTNPVGVISGYTGSLLYWLAQHEVRRGGQPAHYYLVQLAVYEPLILSWWAAGLAMLARDVWRRAPLAALALPAVLAYWSLATVGLYSWAGEKMPWLTLHLVAPMALLAAWALARALRWWLARLRPGNWLVGFVAVAIALISLGYTLLVTTIEPAATRSAFVPWIPLVVVGLLALLTAAVGLGVGWRSAVGACVLALSLAGAGYGIRSAGQLAYRWGDTPRELMVYTQTSPDVRRVLLGLADAATRRGGADQLLIWYDNETVWDWAMRRYPRAEEHPGLLSTAPPAEVQVVLLLTENYDLSQPGEGALAGFQVQRYPLRWWFPEDQTYRLPDGWLTAPVDPAAPLLVRVLRTPVDPATATDFWRYMLFRQPPAALGSSDVIVAVRPELAFELGLGTGGER
ncbi:MAG: TIGR03663 family protein [Chloroflexi bacterium]|nr:TIGR03663 family protein [Chloroflexota bacterium]